MHGTPIVPEESVFPGKYIDEVRPRHNQGEDTSLEQVKKALTNLREVAKDRANRGLLQLTGEDVFTLQKPFLDSWRTQQPDWGPLGEVTYRRTYSRLRDDGAYEEWWQTVQRVIEGVYTYQKWHCNKLNLPWSDDKAQRSAQRMYEYIFTFKFTPPGRGLSMCGTSYVEKYGSAALNNCAFTSTAHIDKDFSQPFVFLMDMSMLGVGVGGDTKGAGKVVIQQPKFMDDCRDVGSHHTVEDSREGWVKFIKRHLDAFVGKATMPHSWDYSQIRPAGTPIKGFGGVASGYQPLEDLRLGIFKTLNPLIGKPITSEAITDLFNKIGVCVVSGNVRRSAIIMLGEHTDDEFLDLKNPEIHAEKLAEFRWTSNNSIHAKIGMDYTKVAERTAKNGEPGYVWIDTSREYGRLMDPPDYADMAVVGVNPCQPARATILTPNGVTSLGNVEIGDVIWSGQEWTTVTNKWSNGIKPVNAYTTRAGTFLGTEQHRIVSHGEKIEVGLAETIDTAQGPQPESVPLNPMDIMDGLVFGDGSTEKKNNRVVLCIGQDDQDYFTSEVAGLIGQKNFPSDPYEYCIETTFTHIPAIPERVIPDRYKLASPEKVRGFLRGVYSANGSLIQTANRISLKSINLSTIQDVQLLLSSLGIRSYYTTNKEKAVLFANGEYVCKRSYDLNITTDRDKFRTLIGFIQKYKQDALAASCNREVSKYAHSRPKLTYEITEVVSMGEEEVFDLTVEADSHTYWTGGLLVSNCSEQSLEHQELCCLVETYPSRCKDAEEYKRVLKFAYLYAKSITLIPTHNVHTNAVQMKNRRIGCSQSGITANFKKVGRRTHLKKYCDQGYKFLKELDRIYSDWLCIPRSKKISSVKPSGSVSLLPGVPPGIHFPQAEYYLRTMRIASRSPLIPALEKAGYRIELDARDRTKSRMVVYFPVHEKNFDRAVGEVSMWEQLENAAALQRYWADNQVSVTVTFKPEEAKDISNALEVFESRLKAVSFLPLLDHGYIQPVYTTITKEEFEEYAQALQPIDFSTSIHEVTDKFCDGDTCTI